MRIFQYIKSNLFDPAWKHKEGNAENAIFFKLT